MDLMLGIRVVRFPGEQCGDDGAALKDLHRTRFSVQSNRCGLIFMGDVMPRAIIACCLALLCTGCVPSGVDTAKIINDILASPAAIAAVLAAGLAFISGVLGPLAQIFIGRRQAAAAQRSADAAMLTAQTAGMREVAKLRLSWMDTLRKTLTEYHGTLMILTDPDPADTDEITKKRGVDLEKLVLLGTDLDLLLNQDDQLQKALWDVTDEIYNTASSADRQTKDKKLIAAGRAVLKGEWEKVKAEMKGSEFQTGTKQNTALS